MALTRITKGVIKPNENYDTHNINSTGIITATKFVGQADISGGSIVGTAATFTGPVTIGGTLTYEDVTNIDSVGIITARDGLKVLAGGANVVGVVTATTFKGDGDFVELDVDGHTNLDNVSIAGVTTFAGTAVNLETGNASTQMQLRFGTNAEKSRITVAGAVNDGYTGSTVGETIFNTNSQLTLAAGGSQALTISSARKVGIGTDNPSQKLDVRGDIIAYENSSGSVRLVQDGNIEITNNNGGIIDFKTADNEDFDCRIRQMSDGLQFMTGGNGSTDERLRITSAGRVMIGHDAPSADLHGSQGTTNRNPFFQLHGANNSSAGAALISWHGGGGSYYSPVLYLARSGSATKGTNGIIPAGQVFGSIVFNGDDGTDFVKGAMITAKLD